MKALLMMLVVFLGLPLSGPSNAYQIKSPLGTSEAVVLSATAQQMRLVSTSASDTLAGTGLQRVILHYLDNAYVERNETISLNGVTPVLTVATNILRVNGLHATQTGSTGAAVGNITLTNTGNTVTYSKISPFYNTAMQAIYTVPENKDMYVSHWQASSGSPTGTHFCQTDIRGTTHDGVLYPGVFILHDSTGTQNGNSDANFPVPIRFPARSDVKLSVFCDTANAGVTAPGAFVGWVE